MFLKSIQWIFIISFKLNFKYLPKINLFKNPINIVGFNSFVGIFTSLFSTSRMLINTIGYTQTIILLREIRRLISDGYLTTNNTVSLVHLVRYTIDRNGVNTISTILLPYWNNCMANPKLFYNYFNIFLYLNYLGIFSIVFKLTRIIIKFSFGAIITSIGILWNESLISIDYLKDFAFYLREFLDNNLDFKIPTLKDGKD
jgi:hypothetical protein